MYIEIDIWWIFCYKSELVTPWMRIVVCVVNLVVFEVTRQMYRDHTRIVRRWFLEVYEVPERKKGAVGFCGSGSLFQRR